MMMSPTSPARAWAVSYTHLDVYKRQTERQCKAWLFTTARNLYCDQLRRAAKEEQLLSTFFPEEDSTEPDFALDTVEAALSLIHI